MNEQASTALNMLADKLGVATEVVWGALLRQAPVTATYELIWFACLSFICYGLWKRVMKINATQFANDARPSDVAFFIGAIGISLVVLITSASLPHTLSGLFNPDYWALKEVLDAIKSK